MNNRHTFATMLLFTTFSWTHWSFAQTPPPLAPSNVVLEEKVQWLVDRAQISDLILGFVRSVDTHDSSRYAASFTDDGVLELPFAKVTGRAAIAAMKPVQSQNASHHISSNHLITVNGDHAVAQAYLQATHVFDRGDPRTYEQAGGWYDFQLQRTDEGWRFSNVKLTVVWESGEMMKRTTTQKQ